MAGRPTFDITVRTLRTFYKIACENFSSLKPIAVMMGSGEGEETFPLAVPMDELREEIFRRIDGIFALFCGAVF
ncbi:MAG: hypothetical protein LBS00_09145 [Synergistaceae bacterium]|nr:hypothetical protein [Synergistaceae bacterium]